MIYDDLLKLLEHISRLKERHLAGFGCEPTRCYLGSKERHTLSIITKYMSSSESIDNAEYILNLRVWTVHADTHLHVC